MSSTAIVVIGMCGLMMVAGLITIRISHRDRGMGAIFIAVGVIGILAFVAADEGMPSPSTGTPVPYVFPSELGATPTFESAP
jgi:hypothetical protein